MKYRERFPVFSEYKELIYLDSAATTQKPDYVIKSLEEFLIKYIGSPNRGSYKLSVMGSQLYEEAREKVRTFLHGEGYQVIFTPGATEGLNMIASGLRKIKGYKGNIVLTITCHHSNLLPWQELAREGGLELRYMETEEDIDVIDENTLITTFPLIVNADGKIHCGEKIIDKARKCGSLTLVDGSQAIGHREIHLGEMDADFFVFSGHKMFALNGIGAILAKEEALEKFEYFFLGGDMIEYVERETSTYAQVPTRYEAGTQNIQGAHSLLKAIEFIEEIGMEEIIRHEEDLFAYAYYKLKALEFIELLSDDKGSTGIIAFNVKKVHPHDVASILDMENICIRAGHHCCQPYFKYQGLNSSCRISFSIYNSFYDIDKLILGLNKVKEIFCDG